jgi:SAM-dependent methyltransferase
MKSVRHRSAGPAHYDWEAPTYDLFNEKSSAPFNRLLTVLLRKRGATSVLDLACGTGSQVFWLARRGFRVVGCDISSKMLGIARRKSRAARLDVDLRLADMRTFRGGSFDAVVTTSNAVGHLTKSDFERAMRNIRGNLSEGGVYVFDIYNLEWLRAGNHITKLTIDWTGRAGGRPVRQVQYSTLDARGVLHSFTTVLMSQVFENEVTLQLYTADELKEMLRRSAFKRVRHVDIDGSTFSRARTERILTIAEC